MVSKYVQRDGISKVPGRHIDHNLIDTILLMSGWGIYILVLLGDLPMAIAIATLCGIQFRLISLD